MHRKLNRKLVIAATTLAVVAFAGGAYAASQTSAPNGRQAFLDDLAKRLNISPQRLDSALDGAFLDQLQTAVKSGKLTQAQANAIKQRLQRGGVPPLWFSPGPGLFGGRGFFGGPGLFGGRGFFGGHRVLGMFGELRAAASYLGLNGLQLRQQLASGKSLAQIAKARGKSRTGLEQAMIAAIRSKLEHAVSGKRITQTQAQRILSTLQARVGQEINATPPRMGFRPSFGSGGRFPAPPPGGGFGRPAPQSVAPGATGPSGPAY